MPPTVSRDMRQPAASTGTKINVEPCITQTSNVTICFDMGRGATSAVAPATPKILNRLDPATLPNPTTAWPRQAAAMVVASSGNEVPKAKSVRPMTSSETPHILAIETPPSISNSAPMNSPKGPAMTAKKDPSVDFGHPSNSLITSPVWALASGPACVSRQ